MNTGDALEWRSNTLLGKLIRLFSREKVNHTSLIVRSSLFDKVLPQRRFLVEALGNGLVFKLASQRLNVFHGQVFWLQLKEEHSTQEKQEKILTFAAMQLALNRGYDYRSLFKNISGPVALNPSRWFCSEFYHACLIYAGILPASKEKPVALRPGQFGELGIYKKEVLIYDN
jgi:hypothetical protein